VRWFRYERVGGVEEAVAASRFDRNAHLLAGGTQLMDLMKLGVLAPDKLIDINGLAPAHAGIELDDGGLHLGALVRMSEAAERPEIIRDYPVIAQSLAMAASPQLRNMASLAGNVLQRTRCNYFRDPGELACNKRHPGSGCAALDGVNRKHAVLGVSSSCIASYPGDFAQALVALDARVTIVGTNGTRELPVEALHRSPGTTPHLENVLEIGDVITRFTIPRAPFTRRSLYLKVRDRASYEFAVVSAAVALDLANGAVGAARIALGGLTAKPWRAREAEASLVGKPLTEATARAAADLAFIGAVTYSHNAFKPVLGRRTLVHALLSAAKLEVS
jgi:xanthine dehydrogenase YagS FAD-binding subunit